MLSFGGDYTSIGALPGVQIALDYINNEPSILPGYSLHYTLTDSQCSRSIAQKSFFHQINSEPPKVGWVGSGCSTATEPTAEITQFYNITQVSCVSSSPTLNNRMRLRYYFQLLAEEVGMARGFLGLIRRFGWRRVGIITQNENLFTATMDALKKSLSEYGIDYLEKVFTTSESIGGLRPNPFEPHIRIYVFAMYSLHARALICEVRKVANPALLCLHCHVFVCVFSTALLHDADTKHFSNRKTTSSHFVPIAYSERRHLLKC
jgi:gamma-aminobutyric acid type B receptor